jgi:hypothetical protein
MDFDEREVQVIFNTVFCFSLKKDDAVFFLKKSRYGSCDSCWPS